MGRSGACPWAVVATVVGGEWIIAEAPAIAGSMVMLAVLALLVLFGSRTEAADAPGVGRGGGGAW